MPWPGVGEVGLEREGGSGIPSEPMRLVAIRSLVAGLAVVVHVLGSAAPVEAQRPIPVNVESTPAGAEVRLDAATGQVLGTTPLRNVRIARGTHTLFFTLANHEDATLSVNINRRRETFTQVLNPLGTISLMAGNTDAEGAQVRVDGAPVGTIPHRMTVQPGRHLVQVGREGFVTFSQWAEIAGGQVLQLPVSLAAEAPSTGSMLVAGDTSGAAIYVDGTPRGSTPTVIEGLTEGEHQIEVRPNDASLQPFRQTVRVIAGERLTLNPTLRPAPAASGSLRVLVNVQGAIVSLDGEVVGAAPATASEVTPGEHIVEARAPGHAPAQQPVTIEPGRQRVISITLTADAGRPGRIVVNANVDGATVLVDGEERGSPPVVVSDATPGTHAIVVRAPGHQEHRQTCSVGPGADCDVTAQLQPVGTPVRVTANVPGEFLVDDEVMGPVPWEGTVPVGSHRIEIRADGYRSYTAQVAFTPQSEVRAFDVGLVGEGELTSEERNELLTERRDRHRQAVSRSGATLPDDLAVLDVSLGWPYLFELRMGIGILDWLEAGIGIRTTFYRLTEFEGRLKAGWRPARQVSLGGQFRLGGGIGPSHDGVTGDELDPTTSMPLSHATNDFFMSFELLFSLHFLNAGNFTLWAALDYHSDRWDWSGVENDCRFERCLTDDDGNYLRDSEGNLRPAVDAEGDTLERIVDRQNQARFRLGGSLEFIASNTWNVWASFEGILAGGPRRILGDMWGLGRDDLEIYARLGFTYKFGYTEREEDVRRPPDPYDAAPPPAAAQPATLDAPPPSQ